jgi:hypothetical protein
VESKVKPEQSQAYQAGRNARERGAVEFDNPKYGIISEARELRQYWRKGWKSRDVELGGKANGT